MRFWRINSPKHESNYGHTFVNGSLHHPYGLPGVMCDVCGQTWSGSRVLPYECPELLQHHKNIAKRWPVARREHEAIQQELMLALSVQGDPFTIFRPGDDLHPCFLDVPSRPRADFLWASLGSLVVSERVKDLLVSSWPGDVTARPVTLRKIGKREARLAPPIPSTGEPEDMIDEVPLSADSCGIGPYFEIIIQKESGYPPGGTPVSTCAGCGRTTVDKSTRRLRMTREMWNGDNVFFLSTTLYILVTDAVRDRLMALHPTNVIFEEMKAPD